MRILLTAFEPFGGSDRNPSLEVVRAIDGSLPGVDTLVLPVVTGTAPGSAWATVLPELGASWSCIVHLGESAKAEAIMVERVAVNLRDAAIADNLGNRSIDEPVVEGGPAAHFATLPTRELVKASVQAGTAAALSLSAGSFLCNETMYRTLHHLHQRRDRTRAGFIHLPQLPEQAAIRGGPSMDLHRTLDGVRAMLRRLGDGPTLGRA